MSCDFVVDVRIVSSDGVTVLKSLQDTPNGLSLLDEVSEPRWREDDSRVRSPYMHGSAPSKLPTIIDGVMPITVKAEGATYVEACQREDGVVDAFRAEPQFFLDVEMEGYTRRYRASREDVQSGPHTSTSMLRKAREVVLVFRVQPNPVVTV